MFLRAQPQTAHFSSPIEPAHWDHVDGLMALNRSPGGVEFPEALLALIRRLIARWPCSRMLFNVLDPVRLGFL